jgi:hypothetical protein
VVLAGCGTSGAPTSAPAATSSTEPHTGTTAVRTGQSTTGAQGSATTTVPQVTTLPHGATTPRHGTTTTTSGKAPPANATQAAHGAAKGDAIVASLANVVNDGSGHVSFTVHLQNDGTLSYNCAALKAQGLTARGRSAIVAPLTGSSGLPCAGTDDSIAPGGSQTFAFLIPLVGGAAHQVIALPFGSYTSKVVWSLSGA